MDFLSIIYHSQLRKGNYKQKDLSLYLGAMLSYDTDGHLNTSLYDKSDDQVFSVTNFTDTDSNIPSLPAYDVLISQLIRFATISSHYNDFVLRAKQLQKMSKSGVCQRLTDNVTDLNFLHEHDVVTPADEVSNDYASMCRGGNFIKHNLIETFAAIHAKSQI